MRRGGLIAFVFILCMFGFCVDFSCLGLVLALIYRRNRVRRGFKLVFII